MAFNQGPIIYTTTADITHNQRMNNIDNNKETTISNSTKNDSSMTPYQSVSLDSQKEILEETERLLEEKKCKDNNCISLYDILSLTQKKHKEYNQFKHNLEIEIHNLMKEGYYLSMYYASFDCSNMFLEINMLNIMVKCILQKKMEI